MRLSNPILLVLALSTLFAAVGCAAPAATMRSADTAVRAEPRRISSAADDRELHEATSEPARRAY